MTLDNLLTIDGVAFDEDARELSLLIVDETDWSDEAKHWQLLGEKINLYLAFLEDGQAAERYPAYDPRTSARVIFVAFAHDFLTAAQRDRFGAFGEAALKQGVRLVGQYEDQDGNVREYSYAP